jgi:excisionase family DNA binding protein
VPERAHEPPICYTPAEAAELLKVTRQTVHAMINRGELRRFKVGHLTRIPRSDVLALVGVDAEVCDVAS